MARFLWLVAGLLGLVGCSDGDGSSGGSTPTGGFASPPVLFAEGQTNAWAIAVDETSVYWACYSPLNVIRKAPLDGGDVVTLFESQDTSQEGPNSIALDATHVYWTGYNGSLMKVPKNGGTAVALSDPGARPVGVAVDESHVFWTTQGPFPGDAQLGRVALDGSGANVLFTGPREMSGIALDAGSVYWGNEGGDALMAVAKTGGSPSTLATLDYPGDVAIDETHVYFIDAGDNGVYRVPKGGGAPELLGTSVAGAPRVAVDAGFVYWTDQGSVDMVRAPKAGGTPATYAAGMGPSHGLTVGPSDIFWSTNGGEIWRQKK